MQQKISPVALLAMVTLAVMISEHSGAAQEVVVGGQPTGYAPAPPPYAPSGYGAVPIPSGGHAPHALTTGRPQSWPGTQVLPRQPGPAPNPETRQFSQYGQPRRYVGQTLHRPPARQQRPAPAEMEPCRGALILAKVGSEVILASEVVGSIEGVLARAQGKVSAEQLEQQRQTLTSAIVQGINDLATRGSDRSPLTQSQREQWALIRQLLQQLIETKLIYHDFRQTIPEENLPKVEESLGKQFEEVELSRMMKEAGVDSRRQLDRKLRARGTSLERRKQAHMQRTLAQQWVREQIKLDEEITYDQMLEYYRNHLADFEKPARARWEELMVSFSKYSSQAEAGAAIARMGNQVAAGAAFAALAKAQSDGTTASEGGVRNWTTKGSLVCRAIDRALFELPVGQLSPIIESEDGFHIVRVTERVEASRTPFLEAQVEIQPKIRQQRTRAALRTYVLGLKEKIPVWTIFDDQPEGPEVSTRRGFPRR